MYCATMPLSEKRPFALEDLKNLFLSFDTTVHLADSSLLNKPSVGFGLSWHGIDKQLYENKYVLYFTFIKLYISNYINLIKIRNKSSKMLPKRQKLDSVQTRQVDVSARARHPGILLVL